MVGRLLQAAGRLGSPDGAVERILKISTKSCRSSGERHCSMTMSQCSSVRALPESRQS
jgi:hypothetical protein